MSIIVMLLGYTIMAVPTGIVSAQFISEGRKSKEVKHRCPECGAPLKDDVHFCPFCGKKQEEKE